MTHTPRPRRRPAIDLAAFRASHGSPRPQLPLRPVGMRAPAPSKRLASGFVVALGVAIVTAASTLASLVFGEPPSPFPSLIAQAAPSSAIPSERHRSEVPSEAIFPWLATYDGRPVGWPCGPIGYRLVLDGAPVRARELLTEAVDRIRVVSGLEFREDPAGDTPVLGYPGIEVSWVPGTDLESSDPNAIGTGGATSTGNHYITGFVKIASDWDGGASADFEAGDAGPVLLHELGHALGLSHTDDPDAIMFPTDHGNATWTAAERAALQYLRQSC